MLPNASKRLSAAFTVDGFAAIYKNVLLLLLFYLLNSDKIQVICTRWWQQLLTTIRILLKDYNITTSRCVTCLDVDFDAELTFATHVKRVSARYYT